MAAIYSLIGKLKGLFLSERLRKITSLAPQIRNVTRWSSLYHMLEERYFQLKDFIPRLDSTATDKLCISTLENKK